MLKRPSNKKGIKQPSTSTDNAIARFDGTAGNAIQSSGVTLDDSNNISLPTDSKIYLRETGNKIYSSGTGIITIDPGTTTGHYIAAGMTVIPTSDGWFNLGSASIRWSNIYWSGCQMNNDYLGFNYEPFPPTWTGAGAQTRAIASGQEGILRYTTDTADDDYLSDLGPLNLKHNAYLQIFFRFKLSSLDSCVKIGLATATGDQTQNCVYLTYDYDVGPNWLIRYGGVSTNETDNTGVAATTDWHTFNIWLGYTNYVLTYLNGSNSGNCQDTNDLYSGDMGAYLYFQNRNGTGAKYLDLDYWQIYTRRA